MKRIEKWKECFIQHDDMKRLHIVLFQQTKHLLKQRDEDVSTNKERERDNQTEQLVGENNYHIVLHLYLWIEERPKLIHFVFSVCICVIMIVSEWMNEWMNEWVSEWMNEWMNEWMSKWMRARVNKWISEWEWEWIRMRMSEWVNKWIVNKWMRMRMRMRMRNEWVSEWVNKWMRVNEWMSIFWRICHSYKNKLSK
jgi:NADH:ubiquinone oxidoreductase subunit 5 (subunit L)/multisubunit Na+/H+ antiporter MnhA subunit